MAKRKRTVAAPAGGHGVMAGRPDWWGKFLLGYIESGTVASAARAAGTTRQNAHAVIDGNADLKAELEEAREIRHGSIRQALYEIGTKGILLPTYALDRRTVIGYETKWSPQILLALAGELPEYNRALNAGSKPTPDDRPPLSAEDADAIVAAIARRVAARQAPPAITDGD